MLSVEMPAKAPRHCISAMVATALPPASKGETERDSPRITPFAGQHLTGRAESTGSDTKTGRERSVDPSILDTTASGETDGKVCASFGHDPVLWLRYAGNAMTGKLAPGPRVPRLTSTQWEVLR